MGESRVLNSMELAISKHLIGTPLYMPPELIKHDSYDHRVDIWALGCFMYHLASLDPPFTGDNLH
jgi:NIMA (never in mitosis gene a)-related kinase